MHSLIEYVAVIVPLATVTYYVIRLILEFRQVKLLHTMADTQRKISSVLATWTARDNKLIGLTWALFDSPELTPETKERLRQVLTEDGEKG